MEPSLTSLPPLLAALTPDAGFGERVAYQINGLIVVFVALGSIWGLLELVGWLFRRAAAARPRVVVPAAPASLPGAADGDIPVETVAVIAAAVAATMGGDHVIRAISPASPDPAWAREGRREVFQSHRIR